MPKTDFRKQLKTLITEKQISIAELARKANLHHGTLYHYLQAKSEMKTDNLAKLFDILNTM